MTKYGSAHLGKSAAVLKDVRIAWEHIALVVLGGLALGLALWNLPYAPRTWFDEGSHLHVPKTLVRYGVYADISSEGFRYYGPTVGIGPTVMLPIAAVFQIVGVGLAQGRLVISVYLALALVMAYILARRLHGPRVALLALALLLASRTWSYDGAIEYGRQVLGEIPGVAFLLLGALGWVAAVRSAQQRAALISRHSAYCLLSGLGFGLALVTKNQFALIVPLALALCALLDWRYYRAGSWRLRLLPLLVACGCFAAWMLVQLQFLGPGGFGANLAQTRQAAGGAIFVFDAHAALRALKYLAQPYGALLLPALLYALYRCRARTSQALAALPVALLPALWLLWYITSLGWPRYAFPAVALGALTTAQLLADAYGWLRARRPQLAPWLVVYTSLAVALPLALSARGVLSPDTSAQQMAVYLNANVPTAALVETWEPELGLLTDHRYHYPPIQLLDTAVRHAWLGGPPLRYDGLADAPPYVVVGSFGAWTNVYPPTTLDRAYLPAYRAGNYTLYRHK